MSAPSEVLTFRSLRILITGAGGLIGRELAGHLAERGHAVLALLHNSTILRRNDGRLITASPWNGGAPQPGSVAALHGDVRQRGLGLGASLPPLDLVLHCAALTGFDCEPGAYQAVNVDGTANVLAYAGEGGNIPVLYVSTAYVCGGRDGPIMEAELDVGQHFTNGYEASKAMAESLVRAAAAAGRMVAVARPSIVVGDSCSGQIGSFSNIYGLIKLVTDGLIRTLPASPGASLDMVPIDHVIGGLTDIAERILAASGRTYHLVSGRPVPVTALRTVALADSRLHAPRFVLPTAYDPALLTHGERRLNGQVTQLYAAYLQRDPRFQDDNLRALSGRVCPPTDEAFLRRTMDYCLATGYVRGRRIPA